VLSDTRPILEPIAITYKAIGPENLVIRSTMTTRSRTVEGVMRAMQSAEEFSPSIIRYAMAVERMNVSGQDLSCGSQVISVTYVELRRLGQGQERRVVPTRGCGASMYLADNGALDSDIISGFWEYPETGLKTGTALSKAAPSNANSRNGDLRGIVVGTTLWRGRRSIVVQLQGCASFRVDQVWYPICPNGVNLIDPTSGLIVGAAVDVEVPVAGLRMSGLLEPQP
jgi:hypothetical protein